MVATASAFSLPCCSCGSGRSACNLAETMLGAGRSVVLVAAIAGAVC